MTQQQQHQFSDVVSRAVCEDCEIRVGTDREAMSSIFTAADPYVLARRVGELEKRLAAAEEKLASFPPDPIEALSRFTIGPNEALLIRVKRILTTEQRKRLVDQVRHVWRGQDIRIMLADADTEFAVVGDG